MLTAFGIDERGMQSVRRSNSALVSGLPAHSSAWARLINWLPAVSGLSLSHLVTAASTSRSNDAASRARARTCDAPAIAWFRQSVRVGRPNRRVFQGGVGSGIQTSPLGQRIMPSSRSGAMSRSWFRRPRLKRRVIRGDRCRGSDSETSHSSGLIAGAGMLTGTQDEHDGGVDGEDVGV
jgi:hypothetical protein